MFEIIKNVAIKSIISVVPKKKIKLKKSEKDKRILRVSRVIGVNQSYKADKNTTVVDLFEKASKEIIKKNFIKKNKIKFLICVTQTPDYLMPSCSNILHQKLSLDKDCIAFDINLGCSGYVYGLFVMMNLVFKSKNNFIGLLLVGDTISKTVNRQDKSNALLFGDGVSATLVKKKIDNKNFFLVGSSVEGFDKLLIKNSGFKLDKKQKMKPEFFMDGKEVFSFAVSTVPKMIDEIIQKSKIKKKNHKFFYPSSSK